MEQQRHKMYKTTQVGGISSEEEEDDEDKDEDKEEEDEDNYEDEDDEAEIVCSGEQETRHFGEATETAKP